MPREVAAEQLPSQTYKGIPEIGGWFLGLQSMQALGRSRRPTLFAQHQALAVPQKQTPKGRRPEGNE